MTLHKYEDGVFRRSRLSPLWSAGITVLLSLTVFMLLVAEIMPATSDSVPLIGGCCPLTDSSKVKAADLLLKVDAIELPDDSSVYQQVLVTPLAISDAEEALVGDFDMSVLVTPRPVLCQYNDHRGDVSGRHRGGSAVPSSRSQWGKHAQMGEFEHGLLHHHSHRSRLPAAALTQMAALWNFTLDVLARFSTSL